MAGSIAYKGKRPADLVEEDRAEPSLSRSSSTSFSPEVSSSNLRAFKRQATLSSPLQAISDTSVQEPMVGLVPIGPILVDTCPTNYDRVNAENGTKLKTTESLHVDLARHRHYSEVLDLNPGAANPPPGLGSRVSCQNETASNQSRMDKTTMHALRCPLLCLPPELIDSILTHLPATALCSVSATCRKLHRQAGSDFHWLRCVQDNVPGLLISSPGPCKSFRELYMAHDPIWFLPKYKIWFCDKDFLMGKLIIARFDPRRGCIEGYQLLAISNKHTLEEWPADSGVVIHGFEPQVKLHLDKPVLQLNIQDRHDVRFHTARTGANRLASEVPMMRGDGTDHIFSNFLLARPMCPEAADAKLALGFPYDLIWPPPTIPARHRVRGADPFRTGGISPYDSPRSRKEVSNQTFRIRHWMQMPGTPSPRSLMGGQSETFPGMVRVLNGPSNVVGDDATPFASAGGVHINETLNTYSTLDPVLYTPTETKPWRGIWVGDYSGHGGHGCEFLLIHQPDDPAVTDAELGLVREVDETNEAWRKRRREIHMYRGRLEAIKLTGDPNVPRGEYSFVAENLGPEGFVGIASDPPFAGVRIVKSKGHLASTNYVRGKFFEGQLLLIGPDRLAQYWAGFGRISFFERVQVDHFLVPP